MLYAILHILGRPLFKILFNLTKIGTGNLPETGGFIAAPNHRSWLDIPVVGAVLPRKMYSMSKKELYLKRTIVNTLYIHLGAIPIDRDSPGHESLRRAIEVTKNGNPLLMFPEGTRSKDNTLGEGKKGVVYIANDAKVPIIPMGIVGTEKVLPKDAKMLKPSHIVVVIGKPFYPWEIFNPKDKDFYDKATGFLMKEIAQCITKADELL